MTAPCCRNRLSSRLQHPLSDSRMLLQHAVCIGVISPVGEYRAILRDGSNPRLNLLRRVSVAIDVRRYTV